MTKISTANINRLWADLIVEELVRSGARLFCLAPGSRSTPLTTAVAANDRAEHVMHFDERGTAFYALGYARATRRPAVWITTSGTAVANGLPAVVEASVDGVPLILLTADRPPELRDTGANQTIDQVKLFGGYVRWQFDLPAPDAVVDPMMLLTTVDQAVYRARRMPAGPVHINAMYREPLAPEDDGHEYSDYLNPLAKWRGVKRPHSRYVNPEPRPDTSELHALWSEMRGVKRGLIIAGRLDSVAQADSVRWLSERLGWPLLPDATSQLRLRPSSSGTIPYYDLVLTSAAFQERSTPQGVLMFGRRPTSKRLLEYLSAGQPDLFVSVSENPARIDPHHRVTHHIEADIVRFCDDLVGVMDEAGAVSEQWIDRWGNASATAESIIARELTELSEPLAARSITSLVPEDSGLVLASSMPVRDVDQYGSYDGNGPFVIANRGASGIDGTVATAAGFARGLRRPATLIMGDLALLHDLNSLALLRTSAELVILVVINNHGGGIFSFLPIARHEDVFEPFFGTPHDFTFEKAAEMFDIKYKHVSNAAELRKEYQAALDDGRSTILEITTDRRENVALHRRIERLIADAVS